MACETPALLFNRPCPTGLENVTIYISQAADLVLSELLVIRPDPNVQKAAKQADADFRSLRLQAI